MKKHFIKKKISQIHKKGDHRQLHLYNKNHLPVQRNKETKHVHLEAKKEMLSEYKNPALSKKEVAILNNKLDNTIKELKKVVVGQDKIIESVLRCLLANGHMLIEGLPGIAKTLIVRALAKVMGLKFERIQFTSDLLPADIIGVTVFEPTKKDFYVVRGPIFTNFVLADEINRCPPKTQSALLEAMQERNVTIGKSEYKLDHPFLVVATQNPIEHLGVYPLPEAEIDRFLFKVIMEYPLKEEEFNILHKNIEIKSLEEYGIKKVLSVRDILKLQKATKDVYIDPKINKYIVEIVSHTRMSVGLKMSQYIQWGASPRATIGLNLAARANALLQGRNFVTAHDVKAVAHDVLRHRILLNYEGQAESIKTDDIIDEILARTKVL